MKWLSAGLTFVNVATVSGLLLGMAAGGLNRAIALLSICLGCILGVFAYRGTIAPRAREKKVVRTPPATESKRSQRKRKGFASNISQPVERSYKTMWLWLVAACFAIFAVRSFCWLLYIDGGQWRIQSPNNLGDLALHITHIRNFASGVALWPENPIYCFSHLRYPAGVDLFNALLFLVGVDVQHGLIWAGLLGSLATFYAFWRWGGVFSIAGFLFNGGVAGFQIVQTRQWKWIDYQGVSSIAWKSIPLSMLVTQRGLLYAIPVGLLLLCQWRERFFTVAGVADLGTDEERLQRSRLQPLPFWIECTLYASMPLFHLHTFIALSILLGFWFLIGGAAMRKQLLLLGGCAFLPATFFVSLITDYFQAGSVLEWKPGWVQSVGDFAKPFFEFWWMNFGIALPLALLLVGICLWQAWKADGTRFIFKLPANLAFLIPASAIFILACLVRTAPWEWDNIKIIIWAYFMALPFLWKDLIVRGSVPVRVGICVALFGSGFVTLMGGLAAGSPGFGFANRAEIDGVGFATRELPAEARFAAYPTYNHPLLLNGRKVVLGYDGHLMSQGFHYAEPLNKLTSLMNGAPDWRKTARDLHARYLFWGSEEKLHYGTSKRPWESTSPRVATGNWGAIYDLEPAKGSVAGAQ
jgi:hypothetical protein